MSNFQTPLRVIDTNAGENSDTVAPTGVVYGNLDGGINGGATKAEINRNVDVSARLVNAGATLAVTEALHEGKTIRLDQLAGCTCTLPASTGGGAKYRFVISVVPTSNNHIVKVANSTDVFRGFANMAQDAGDTSLLFEAAGTSDTITLNRSTTGGTQIGEYIEFEDVLAGFWAINACLAGTGTEATPFSATV